MNSWMTLFPKSLLGLNFQLRRVSSGVFLFFYFFFPLTLNGNLKSVSQLKAAVNKSKLKIGSLSLDCLTSTFLNDEKES